MAQVTQKQQISNAKNMVFFAIDLADAALSLVFIFAVSKAVFTSGLV